MIRRALLFARSIQNLRARQIFFQAVRRVQRPVARAGATSGIDSGRIATLRVACEAIVAAREPVNQPRTRGIADGRFTFLNHEEHLANVDWRRRNVSHLWNYNLHYFDYAVDLARAWRETGENTFLESFQRLSTGWIDATEEAEGDGWQPYALSVRIVNWAYALALFGDDLDLSVEQKVIASLHRQASTLSRRLEWHILANHLQKNLHALLVAGLFFEGEEPERWKALALKHLWKELDEQVLPDGGHFERSPMYHALALTDFLEDTILLRAVGIEPPHSAITRLRAMAEVMGRLVKPDHSLALLNDSANGIAQDSRAMARLASTVFPDLSPAEPGGWSLPVTGYFGRQAHEASIIVDCGEPGPAYQPGHAHCDILSFELDLFEQPFIVDSGVHGYDGDEYREFVRSTRAHNTVMIGGAEQSEVWSTFRMARRARVLGARSACSDDRFSFTGCCSPFHDVRAVHERTISQESGKLRVSDVVKQAHGAELLSFVHFHPDVSAELRDGKVHLASPGVNAMLTPFGVDDLSIVRGQRGPVQGWFCPEFGVALPNSVIVMRVAANASNAFGYRLEWTPVT